MVDDKIIERIRKMFALSSNNPNDNEAESAMRMAKKLLDKYNLSMSDLSQKNDVCVKFKAERNMPWVRMVFNNISSLYDCEYILDKTGLSPLHLLIGNEANRVTASIVIEYVIETIDKVSKGKGNGFRNAMAYGVRENVHKILNERAVSKEEVIPGTGLVPVDLSRSLKEQNKAWIRENMGRINKSKVSRASFDSSGISAGRNINLNTQIGGKMSALT